MIQAFMMGAQALLLFLVISEKAIDDDTRCAPKGQLIYYLGGNGLEYARGDMQKAKTRATIVSHDPKVTN